MLKRRASTPDGLLPEVRNVLIVRLDEIGDVVLTTPLFRELRRNLPTAHITLVVRPHVAELMRHCPYVNEVLAYECDTAHLRWQRFRQHLSAIRFSRKHLWARRYDLALLPRWDVDQDHAAFVTYFSGAKWRMGYSETVSEQKQRLNGGLDHLLTHPINDRAPKHEVERSLALLHALGGNVSEAQLELWTTAEDEVFAERTFRQAGIAATDTLIALCPAGGTSPLKQWPVSRFVELGCRLQAEHSARLMLVGGSGEESLGAELERGLNAPALNLIGQTTLRQLAAVLRRCSLYVGNDTGPMHVAAAMDVPVVALFGSSCRHRFHPWSENHQVVANELPCSPCIGEPHRDRCVTCIYDEPRCMHELPIARVEQTIGLMLSALQNETVNA
ncbi:MAG TPA: glycosyltransferase family 9 protein [Blastocatellia bacterium]|nr:glycosyltransferase family 9 protein [Blastocatellia bacterium]HMX28596.1 glycosyltransferase family 9 protein [Blastocatellia bacterium]HMY70501.1 glycosyltransferase family 9 protein [Blastocatellia bacterium]HMZ17930.1 glycosyltransferase family 9 protein [Blastocatellia bacterium]HNG34511.1 glycosyltransferase family 9 protein [Blastocatellia bacterium]